MVHVNITLKRLKLNKSGGIIMAKYKVGDIFINHKDGKILQVCEGDSCIDCCYNKDRLKKTCLEGMSCFFLIGINTCFKELPLLPPGTKVKMREDLKEGTKYEDYTYVNEMQQYKEVTIKQYCATSKGYNVIENIYIYTLEMFDQVINESKTNNMETKEIKINVPEGYEIDKENSTFECIKFKPIKKELTYEDMAEELFSDIGFYIISNGGIIPFDKTVGKDDKNNATNKNQLERLLALNQLLNIAEYYNKKSPKEENYIYRINFEKSSSEYFVQEDICPTIVCGLVPIFNNKEDAKAVIDNPNFKEILNLIYKCDED